MDTAAAAAVVVAVDLSPTSNGKAPLLSSSKASYALVTGSGSGSGSGSGTSSNPASGAACDCLGSTVEAMSVTPPPTPPSRSGDSHAMESCKSSKDVGAQGAATASPAVETRTTQDSISHPATSQSSANASTTPTSALLATATATAAPGTGSGSGSGMGTSTVTGTGTPATDQQSPAVTTTTTSPPPSVGELLHWQDMPQYLQFNPYVLRGYRPLQTFKGCLLSLFYWHNETINILTHAIPIFYILAIVPGLMPWDSGYKFLSFCHVFGSVAPWCGSFVYHLFMNIEKGENVYYTLLKLDMVGIWVSQSFGALPLVTATTLCFPPVLKWVIIISYCVLSLWGLYKALTASSPWQRRLCFALPFAMRSILTFLRIRGMVGGSHMALSHVYLQDGVSILGGAIGAMRIPEKWFPGVVDFYLNSHNIMHVLVVVAVYSMHKATIKDFEWMSTQTCHTVANVTEQALGHVEL
ncbi:progestin and adipoQ receptor family member 4 [Drosophila bipectinata]|uniref:progestin and adipoQ receptor family member 4 n=1 Tax=Drosophila bipectinata TaxID=42026 RepID=UPI001C8B0684|nr:progestin and adipoQ receptor family member 4 isoform X2 [Drosophila bipectinata]